MTSRRFNLFLALLLAMPLAAAERTVRLDPQSSSVRFTLDATGHTVRGTIDVLAGELRYDPDSGSISGTVSLDATSADTENRRRDSKMHEDVLMSAKFPRISFSPSSVEGRISGEGSVKVRGVMTILGKDHQFMLPARVTLSANRISARATFDVPYVEWGLKDPSVLMIRVAKHVRVDVLLQGTVVP